MHFDYYPLLFYNVFTTELGYYITEVNGIQDYGIIDIISGLSFFIFKRICII